MPEKHSLTLVILLVIHILNGISMAGVSTATATIAQLFAEVTGPVRQISTIPGIRHLIDLPFAALNWKNNREKERKESSNEGR